MAVGRLGGSAALAADARRLVAGAPDCAIMPPAIAAAGAAEA